MALRAMTVCGQVGVSAPEAGDLDDVFEALLLRLALVDVGDGARHARGLACARIVGRAADGLDPVDAAVGPGGEVFEAVGRAVPDARVDMASRRRPVRSAGRSATCRWRCPSPTCPDSRTRAPWPAVARSPPAGSARAAAHGCRCPRSSPAWTGLGASGRCRSRGAAAARARWSATSQGAPPSRLGGSPVNACQARLK